jgi:hypothetical protein
MEMFNINNSNFVRLVSILLMFIMPACSRQAEIYDYRITWLGNDGIEVIANIVSRSAKNEGYVFIDDSQSSYERKKRLGLNAENSGQSNTRPFYFLVLPKNETSDGRFFVSVSNDTHPVGVADLSFIVYSDDPKSKRLMYVILTQIRFHDDIFRLQEKSKEL